MRLGTYSYALASLLLLCALPMAISFEHFYAPRGQSVHIGLAIVRNVLSGDINHDGAVNIFDAIVFSGIFGSTLQSQEYDPSSDINMDGTVDIFDAILLATNFGKSLT